MSSHTNPTLSMGQYSTKNCSEQLGTSQNRVQPSLHPLMKQYLPIGYCRKAQPMIYPHTRPNRSQSETNGKAFKGIDKKTQGFHYPRPRRSRRPATTSHLVNGTRPGRSVQGKRGSLHIRVGWGDITVFVRRG